MRSNSGRFPNAFRLKNTQDFNHAFNEGLRVSNEYLTATACPNDISVPRLGFAVSRRVAPAAHERNRIKRIVRESFRKNAERLRGTDVIVQANTRAVAASNKLLHESIEGLWHRVIKKLRAPPLGGAVPRHRTRLPHG